LTWRHR